MQTLMAFNFFSQKKTCKNEKTYNFFMNRFVKSLFQSVTCISEKFLWNKNVSYLHVCDTKCTPEACYVQVLMDFLHLTQPSDHCTCMTYKEMESEFHFNVNFILIYNINIQTQIIRLYQSGLLIFHADAELQISSKSMKSCEIHKNTQNPAKLARKLTKYMSAQHI